MQVSEKGGKKVRTVAYRYVSEGHVEKIALYVPTVGLLYLILRILKQGLLEPINGFCDPRGQRFKSQPMQNVYQLKIDDK